MKLKAAIPTWPHTLAKIASSLCILFASGILIAWIFQLWIPKQYQLLIHTFKVNTVLCFILSGIALWLHTEAKNKYTHSVSYVAAALVLLISSLTLFEYFFNINLNIDQLFFADTSETNNGILYPGRMTPLTAINFVLLSLSLLFIDNRFLTYRIGSLFITIVILNSVFEFLYHLYSYAYGNTKIINLTQTTVLISFLFILLSIGILFVRPTRGLVKVLISENNSGKLARRLIPPSVLLPIIIGYVFLAEKAEYRSIFNVAGGVLITILTITFIILINSYFVNKRETADKKRAEDLKEFQTLALKSAEAGTWIWNIKKNHMVTDAHLHELFGVKIGNLPVKFESFFNFMHPDDRARIDNEVKDSLEHRSEFESEFRIFHPDGQTHHLATRGHIFRDYEGKPIKMAGICWDITQRIQAEQDLRAAKERAEQLAAEANEANRAKSAFLAAMSHEIRTPLNGVMATLELLFDTKLTPEQCEYIATARSSGDDLLNVISDIIDYSKIESGRFEIDLVDFNLQSLLDETVEKYVPLIQEKGLAIDAVIDANVPEWVNGDNSRVRQILSNILNNAVKFTEKGEIYIQIKLLDPESHTDNYDLLFEVHDTGVGIYPEIRDRLFKPFSQGDDSDRRRHGGTGLGLAISKRLVEALGGKIGVESTPGVGSKFWFKLPLNKPVSPKVKEENVIDPQYQNERILCVDDNPITREIMLRTISSWKLPCKTSSNAGEALALLIKAAEEGKPYTLVLADYVMPGMNGLELIKIMRRLKEIDKTNVIIISPTGASFGLEEMKKLHILMCLTKPLRPRSLYQAILTAFEMIFLHKTPPSIIQEDNKNISILLAEDNPTNTQVAMRILSKLGFNADAVTNGLDVLEALKKKNYDLILMDCQMPGMDGYRATQEIRKIEEKTGKHIFIIAMTAHALKGDRQRCLAAGMDDYISKPIEIPRIAATLQRWVGNIKKAEFKASKEKKIKQDTLAKKTKVISAHPEIGLDVIKAPILDMNRIEEIFGDDKEIIRQFLKEFCVATETLLTEIDTAISNQDVEVAKDLLHRLKGSAGNSGVMGIYHFAKEAEANVLNKDWQSVNAIFNNIKKTFRLLQDEIKVLLDT